MEQDTRKGSNDVPVNDMTTYRKIVMVRNHSPSLADYITSRYLQAGSKRGPRLLNKNKGAQIKYAGEMRMVKVPWEPGGLAGATQ